MDPRSVLPHGYVSDGPGTGRTSPACHSAARSDVDAFGASMLAFHPAGLRATARASAENLRDVLPTVAVPTLSIYGDRDVRAPLTVARDLRAAITGASRVHVSNIEVAGAFNAAVRTFAVA